MKRISIGVIAALFVVLVFSMTVTFAETSLFFTDI